MAKLASLLSDSKTRIILIIVALLLIIGVVIGVLGVRRKAQEAGPSDAQVASAPDIQSMPGVGQASREYIKTQQQADLQAAQEAAKKGTDVIPTITRTTYLGGAGQFAAPDQASTSPACSPEALKRARAAGVSASELRCKGCSAAALRAAGYTAGDLLNAGFTAKQLHDAGYSAKQLADAGYNSAEVGKAGYSPVQLASANVSSKPADVANCSVASLKAARAKGISAKTLREQRHCSAAQFKAAGFTAKELKAAGFTAGQLLRAGFTPKQLLAAGFTPSQLRAAGVSAAQLAALGVGQKKLADAGFTKGDLTRAGLATEGAAKDAAEEGTGVTTTGDDKDAAAAEIAGLPPSHDTGVNIPSVAQSPASEQLAQLQHQQAQEWSQQQRSQEMQELQQGMTNQARDLFTAWSPPPTQQFEEAPPPEKTAAGSAAAGEAGAANGEQVPTGPAYKAGSVLFAVLDTAINTDEQSPVMATIVSGPLKGSKLVGAFEPIRTDAEKKVVLRFNLISVPWVSTSTSLNAVAIDPNTARTALASSVNSHYLLRYGSLFASAFLEGLGQAIQQSGSSTTVSTAGITTTHPELNTSEKLFSALGKVGTRYSEALGQNFDRLPTIKVKAGIGIGVLLMQDLQITKPPTKQA